MVVGVLLLGGCAGQWVKVGNGEQQVQAERYSVSLPDNWVKRALNDELIVSRDGPDLQQIVVRAASHAKAFPNIERESRADMLPSELSAMFVAELKKKYPDGLPSLKIERDEPAQLDGHEGFFLQLAYSTDSGVRYGMLVYGAASEKGFVSISFDAPLIHFFERDRAVFERTSASLKLL